ncbi:MULTISPECIES: glycoside hydrolase family 97 catalytic domain-containing protein [unclassified Breznakia]|uniref:glycoside hydrolase family 97 catalytic domain-containing protein n=1 Tax=unclassified Breznakia TaxID=2623764 RepID=UPI0024745F2E|nr:MULTISPECIES: glycoside hydrolase family 97 catalytic domain-containing protein [unclassified Breznakia]MDH6365920.1 hypothetical protein [Breznakia sp. PH1-1]MDH6403148.1 hypothetical protein [Breznakia sp. PF1-11]MDH6410857.1 hypothetical protein [Breznakia sp. PFB1-11]MDH6413086.1 hypothetical protein [Breznakia sp. PFB1-14]MDH6415454.1 hypothetical protein [Breznakia sp. PFB1-4]
MKKEQGISRKSKLIQSFLALSVVVSMMMTGFISNDYSTLKKNQFMKGIEHITQNDQEYVITSPNQKLKLHIFKDNNQLYYEIKRDEKVYMEKSILGFTMDQVNYGKDITLHEMENVNEINRKFTFQGKQSESMDHCIYSELPVTHINGNSYKINVRVHDDGVAFAYDVSTPVEGEKHEILEHTQFVVPEGTSTWAAIDNENYANYETIISESDPQDAIVDQNGKDVSLLTGVTFDLPGEDGYSAILEGNMNPTYGGTSVAAKGNRIYQIRTNWSKSKDTLTTTGAFQTPWRIICVADDLNELVNNVIVFAVNEDPDNALFADKNEWITPGRSAWSWLNGMVNAVTPQNMKNYTELAAKLGFEYNTIDEGWVFWNGGNKHNYDKELYKFDLARVAEFGEEYGVKQFLWNCVNDMTGNMPGMSDISTITDFLNLMEETGMAGGKIDFWPNESSLSTIAMEQATIRLAAQKKLLLNLHGIHKPSGWSVTYPNEVTREGIRGYEQVNYDEKTLGIKAAPYVYYTTQPFTRYLQGHADFTPHVRSAGEIATLVFGDSPVNMISTDPADILQSEAVEMIKSIPTTWDRTYVLPQSKIGDTTIFAREKDNIWYIGGVTDNSDKDIEIDFSEFLGAGEYRLELWRDTEVMSSFGEGGHKVQDKMTIHADVKLPLHMIEHGGFVMRVTKLTLSQYGGEIIEGKPLEVFAPNGSIVKYTIDGTDPMTSVSAKLYDTPIVLSESCQVRIAICEGDGKGTSISHRFNKINRTARVRSDLKDAIDKASGYDEDHHTEQSFGNLKLVLTDAQVIYENEQASETELVNACNNLLNAIKQMEERVYKGVYHPDTTNLLNWKQHNHEDSAGESVSAKDALSLIRNEVTIDFSKVKHQQTVVFDDASPKLYNGVFDVNVQTDDASSIQFVIRHRNEDNYVLIKKENDGWAYHQKVDGILSEVEGDQQIHHDVQINDNKKHNIKIIYVDKNIELYVDGVYCESFTSTSLFNGAGTYGFMLTDEQRMHLSNVKYVDAIAYNKSFINGDYYDLSMSNMQASAGSSQYNQGPDKAIDNDPSTMWHTSYSGALRNEHYITIDLGEKQLVDGLRYLPRQSGGNNGKITEYAVDISEDDGTTFKQVATGFFNSDNAWKLITFMPTHATHIRLRSLQSITNSTQEFTSAAELRPVAFDYSILDEEAREIPLKNLIASAGSAQNGEGADKAIDDQVGSNWHTSWNGDVRENMYIDITINGDYEVDGLKYLPRQTGNNGKIIDYVILVSEDGSEFKEVANGTWDETTSWKLVNFEKTKASCVRLFAKTSLTDGSNKNFASAAEIRLLGRKKNISTDKSVLQESIDAAKNIQEIDYTKESYAFLINALAKANEVNENINATQVEIDEQVTLLEQAISKLVRKETVDKTRLQQAYDEALLLDASIYTTDSWQQFTSVLTQVKTMLDASDVTQVEVDEQATLLEQVISKLVKKEIIDKTKLQQAYNEALLLDASIYTTDSWQQFTSVLTQVKTMLDASDVTQVEIDEMLMKLKNTIAALDEQPVSVDKAKLEELILEIENMNEMLYTPNSWSNVFELLIKAKTVLVNQQSTQVEIDQVYLNLAKCKGELRLRANTDALEALIMQVQALDKEIYTSDSLSVLLKVLENAQNIIRDANASQQTIDELKQELQDAMVALEKIKTSSNVNQVTSNPATGDITHRNVLWLLGTISLVGVLYFYKTKKNKKVKS